MMPQLFRDGSDAIGEIKRLLEILERVFLLQMMFTNHLPLIIQLLTQFYDQFSLERLRSLLAGTALFIGEL